MTTTPTKHIDELHFEHQLWLSEAKFYTDELRIYQKRLEEIASKNTGSDIRKSVEHFQNQFIIQKEQLDILNHLVNEHEQWLSKYAKENPTAIDKKLFANHSVIEAKIISFRNIFKDLKLEFNKFLAASL